MSLNNNAITWPQCYRQWAYRATLCITIKIRIWVVAYFFNFFHLFQKEKKNIKAILCNFSMRLLKFFFALKKLKKPPQKVAYLSRNSVVSEIFHLLPTYCPTAQMAKFMFQNVVHRATVHRTGVFGYKYGKIHSGILCGLFGLY